MRAEIAELTALVTDLEEKHAALFTAKSEIGAELHKVQGLYDDAKEEINQLRLRRGMNLEDLNRQRAKIAALQDRVAKQDTKIEVQDKTIKTLLRGP